jgi:hypothetical protein
MNHLPMKDSAFISKIPKPKSLIKLKKVHSLSRSDSLKNGEGIEKEN